METITLTASDLKIKLLVVMQNQKASADYLGFAVNQRCSFPLEREMILELEKEDFFECEVSVCEFDNNIGLQIKHEHGEILLFSK